MMPAARDREVRWTSFCRPCSFGPFTRRLSPLDPKAASQIESIEETGHKEEQEGPKNWENRQFFNWGDRALVSLEPSLPQGLEAQTGPSLGNIPRTKGPPSSHRNVAYWSVEVSREFYYTMESSWRNDLGTEWSDLARTAKKRTSDMSRILGS
jgi:hypothetical protein